MKNKKMNLRERAEWLALSENTSPNEIYNRLVMQQKADKQVIKKTVDCNTVVYNEDEGVYLCDYPNGFNTTLDPLQATMFSQQGAIGLAKELSFDRNETWAARPITFEITVGEPVT